MSVVDLFVSGFCKAGEGVLSSPGLIWNEVDTTSFGADQINDVAFGGGKYVAVGENGKIAHSSDGETWTQAGTPSFGTTYVVAVTYGDSKFVAVGYSGKIAYSTDGNTWTQAGTPSFGTDNVRAVTYGNGKFVAGGDNGKLAYSTDGDTWTQSTDQFNSGSSTVLGLGYADSTYVVIGTAGNIEHSTDAESWTPAGTNPISSGVNLYGIAALGSGFIVVGTGGTVAKSIDGDVWTIEDSDDYFGTTNLLGVAEGNDVLIATGWSATLGRSTDGGEEWGVKTYGTDIISSPFEGSDYLQGIAYDDTAQRWVVVGYLGSDSSGIIMYSDWLEAGSGIVEQGSNSNGEYIIFSSGRQICWRVMANTASSATTWTFPKAFGSTTELICLGAHLAGAGNNINVSFAAPTTSSVSWGAIVAKTATYYGSAANHALLAIGTAS